MANARPDCRRIGGIGLGSQHCVAILVALGIVLALHIGLFAISDLTTVRAGRNVIGPAGFRNFFNYSFLWLGLLANAVALVFTYFACRAIQVLALRFTLLRAFRPE